MDDFLEQMLSASSWGDGASANRASWDATAVTSANSIAIDSVGRVQVPSKNLSTLQQMPSFCLVGSIENQGLNRVPQEGDGGRLIGLEHGDSLFDTTQAQENSHISLQRLSERGATGGTIGLQLNASTSQALPPIGGASRGPSVLKSDSFEGSGFHHTANNLQSPTLIAPTWRKPYIGTMPPITPTLGQGKSDTFLLSGEGVSSEVHLGKRIRDDEDMSRENFPASMIHAVTQSEGLHSGQGYEDQSPLGQNPAGTAINGAPRPRVRARRGQATDPHSIAERNRRERIAERMKALQELVPDSNKTDKASMLDEIIGYVKFLQMQVKCLSMCRLGGAGAAAPLLADLPTEGNFMAASLVQANGLAGTSQDGMAFAERQVARLMDEDMSAAMQYLQSKGLCLMPISLATAISTTGARQQSSSVIGLDGGGENEKQALDLQAAAVSGITNSALVATLANSGAISLGNDDAAKSGRNAKILKDRLTEDNVNEKSSNAFLGMPFSTIKGGLKIREDPQI